MERGKVDIAYYCYPTISRPPYHAKHTKNGLSAKNKHEIYENGQLFHYRAFLLYYQAIITLSIIVTNV